MYGIKLVFSILLFCFVNADLFSQTQNIDYPYNVGNIAFDSITDNPKFEVIDEKAVLPYMMRNGMLVGGMSIEGEKYGVLEYFSNNYKRKPEKGQTGFIVIRFLVNYRGETDRFRKYEMNTEFQPFKFDSCISDTIFNLTKKLTGWRISEKNQENTTKKYDYYQYIAFKMKDGLIEHILP